MSKTPTAPMENMNYGKHPPSISVNFENITVDALLQQSLYTDLSCDEPKKEEILYIAHDHAVFELFIVENGEVRINAGESIKLKATEMLLIRPRVIHHVASASDSAKYFCLRFDMHTHEKLPYDSIPPYKKIPLNSHEFNLVSVLISELRRSVSTSETPPQMYRIKAEIGIIISYVLDNLADILDVPKSDSNNHLDLYAKIENYLYLNYEKKLTLESLAAHLSYSRTHMRRIMDACYGMPFTKKLREIRLEAAKKYLAETELSVDEIAEKCGYETRQGFESMFLKYVGTTPNKYRKSVTM